MYGKTVVSMLLILVTIPPAISGRPTRFRVLDEGRQQGEADARELVISDASALSTLWDELHAKSDRSSGGGTAAPKVNFATHVVVFIQMEPHRDTDPRIDVTRVVKERARAGQNAETIVTVEETRRETGCSMIVSTTQPKAAPYVLVEVAGTPEEKIVFRHVQKEIPCRSYIP